MNILEKAEGITGEKLKLIKTEISGKRVYYYFTTLIEDKTYVLF